MVKQKKSSERVKIHPKSPARSEVEKEKQNVARASDFSATGRNELNVSYIKLCFIINKHGLYYKTLAYSMDL